MTGCCLDLGVEPDIKSVKWLLMNEDRIRGIVVVDGFAYDDDYTGIRIRRKSEG